MKVEHLQLATKLTVPLEDMFSRSISIKTARDAK